MKEQYEHDVTFYGVLHAEKPSRAGRARDRTAASPPAAAGLWGACARVPRRAAPGGCPQPSAFRRRGGCHHGY